MRLPKQFQVVYRRVILPVLRSGGTLLFRCVVKLAASTGLLEKGSTCAEGEQECIAVVQLSNHVGDTVMLLPMIEALRRAHPAARILCIVQAPIGSYLRLVPSLDAVHELTIDHGQTATLLDEFKRLVQIVRGFWKDLRHTRPTTCIIPRWGCGYRDLMLSYVLQAPNRIGFASNDFDRTQPPAGYRDTLLTCMVRGAQRMSDPARFLFLVQQAGLVPRSDPKEIGLRPSASMLHIAATVDWRALAARAGLDPDCRFAVVAPSASAPQRMWPVERWATLVEGLHSSGLTVVLLAGKSDAQVARQLYELVPMERRSQTALVAGTTSLTESTCLIAHSQLFAGSDSGPGHIAGALGIPCVILFIAAEGADPDGPSAPERVGPMGRQVAWCRPARTIAPCIGYCTANAAHCILEIQPEQPQHAMQRLLRGDTPA